MSDSTVQVAVPAVAGILGLLLGIGAVVLSNPATPTLPENPDCAAELTGVQQHNDKVRRRINEGNQAMERMDDR